MTTAALTLLALCGFAANSLLCRAALASKLIDPACFTALRIVSGALALWALTALRSPRGRVGGSWEAAAALVAYALFFSFAYVRLDAGIGALLLFGTVQLTLIGVSVARGARPAPREWAGLLVALGGLALLTLPGKGVPASQAAIWMAVAGMAWGAYTLKGKREGRPFIATAGNVQRGAALAIPFGLVAWQLGERGTVRGALLAAISGAVTSGMAYAVWYAVLPKLRMTQAAISQLSVPVLAMAGGVLWLGETIDARKAVAAALVLVGIALATLKK